MQLETPFHSKDQNDIGFALVITLIMLVLAAIIVIALLSAASLERVTARSTEDQYQADLAAQNGLEAAKKILSGSPTAATSITSDDNFLVLRVDGAKPPNGSGNRDAYYFLAKPTPRDPKTGKSTSVECYPLFAGGAVSTLAIDHVNYPPLQRPIAPVVPYPTNPAQDTAGNPYPALFSYQQGANTQWQEIRDPNDAAVGSAHNLPYQRYTFWVEDLSGYLDASAAGNTNGSGATHQRNNGTNPNEIALFTIFDATIANDSGKTPANTLINNRALLFTTPTLQHVAPPAAGKSDVTQPTLAVRFGIDLGGERNLIPFGFGFVDEGKPKTNLNTILTSASTSTAKVSALAKVIDDNLPQFSTLRKGGFPATENYTKTIAASILDYADVDSDATVGTGYRGIDTYPFVVEFFERFNWQTNAGESTNFYLKNGTWWADVRVTGYIQLWNMTTSDITSGTLQFTDINRYYAWAVSNPTKFGDDSGSIIFTPTNKLLANEFKAFAIYDKVYNFDTGLAVQPTGSTAKVKLGDVNSSSSEPDDSGYLVHWNNGIVDRAGAGSNDGAQSDPSAIKYANLNYSGLDRNIATPQTPHQQLDPSWRGTLPGLRYDSTSESIYNLGDPRSAYYITKFQGSVSYAKRPSDGSSGTPGNSSWWGRIFQTNLIQPLAPPQKWFAAETLVSNWPDGDHVTDPGLLPSDTTFDPTTIPGTRPVTQSAKAPVYISNAGSYSSVTELGHIYDPLQWRPSGFGVKPTSSAAVAAVWKDAWKNDMVPDSNYGNASTLRIGSPEFKQFDTDDSRATHLLDLFSTADRVDTRGLLNINTAGREALRALAAGLQFQKDSAIAPSTVYGPVSNPSTPVEADKFADAVISSRPFLASSQLSGILTTPTDKTSALFGNSSQWVGASAPTEWTDRAREEYFARIFNLSSVRSRNFRVFTTGQSLDKNGKVLSTVKRVYQVFLRPQRSTGGAITSQSVEITYAKDL